MRHQAIEDALKTASEEDADVIGLQYFAAGSLHELPKRMTLLKEKT